jgi:hypothetical protein
MQDTLLSTALLGTRSTPLRIAQLPAALSATLEGGTAAVPESQLLDTWAALSLYRACGAQPSQGIALPEPCPPDAWPACSHRAGELLQQAQVGNHNRLIAEWLELAAAAQRHPPHRLLPSLLDWAVAQRDQRARVAQVADQRGRWLAAFNPPWQFAEQLQAPALDAWLTGTREQRALILREMRTSDPPQGRALLESAWKTDPADERTQWTELLSIGLSDADEPFLEQCLDDRSLKVREAAADLLARLPGSALVRRMIARMTSLLTFAEGTSGSLLKLKRGTKATLQVNLPEACDAAMIRDGIKEKPSETIGQRQWWWVQMLGCVPLAHWTNTFQASPQTLLAAAPREFADLLRRGWLAALARIPNEDWVLPLIEAAPADAHWPDAVLRAIPEQQRAAAVELLLSKNIHRHSHLPQWIAAWSPWSAELSQVIVTRCHHHELLPHRVVYHLHPSLLNALEAKVAGVRDTPSVNRQVDETIAAIAWRREIRKELAR